MSVSTHGKSVNVRAMILNPNLSDVEKMFRVFFVCVKLIKSLQNNRERSLDLRPLHTKLYFQLSYFPHQIIRRSGLLSIFGIFYSSIHLLLLIRDRVSGKL